MAATAPVLRRVLSLRLKQTTVTIPRVQLFFYRPSQSALPVMELEDATGVPGALKNRASDCYINSLMHMLFSDVHFRRLVVELVQHCEETGDCAGHCARKCVCHVLALAGAQVLFTDADRAAGVDAPPCVFATLEPPPPPPEPPDPERPPPSVDWVLLQGAKGQQDPTELLRALQMAVSTAVCVRDKAAAARFVAYGDVAFTRTIGGACEPLVAGGQPRERGVSAVQQPDPLILHHAADGAPRPPGSAPPAIAEQLPALLHSLEQRQPLIDSPSERDHRCSDCGTATFNNAAHSWRTVAVDQRQRPDSFIVQCRLPHFARGGASPRLCPARGSSHCAAMVTVAFTLMLLLCAVPGLFVAATDADVPRHEVSPSEKVILWGVRYSLRGVVLHHGATLRSGHYTSYVKRHSGSTDVDGDDAAPSASWYSCNDLSIRRLNRAPELDADAAIKSYMVCAACNECMPCGRCFTRFCAVRGHRAAALRGLRPWCLTRRRREHTTATSSVPAGGAGDRATGGSPVGAASGADCHLHRRQSSVRATRSVAEDVRR